MSELPETNDASLPSFLTKKEVAKRVRLGVLTLNRLIRNGEGPAVTQLGGKALIRTDALTDWIERNTNHMQAAE